MRKDKEKGIIKPTGSELMDYLNRGFAICNKCGAVMNRVKDPKGGCDIYACPSCGWEIDEMEYEYEENDPLASAEEEIPACCEACGGPYPDCRASCKLFDE